MGLMKAPNGLLMVAPLPVLMLGMVFPADRPPRVAHRCLNAGLALRHRVCRGGGVVRVGPVSGIHVQVGHALSHDVGFSLGRRAGMLEKRG